jgi:hypothetical protein
VVDVISRPANCRHLHRAEGVQPVYQRRSRGQPDPGSGPAPGRQRRAHHRHGHHRRPGPRRPVRNTGDEITVPVGVGTLGRVLNLLGEPIDNAGPVKADKPIPSTARPRLRPAGHQGHHAGHRHQGHRPARPLQEGRQDRPVRRRRRGQDRADSGAHPQHRHRTRRLLRVRRRGRAHPRGHRALPRNEASRASSTRPPWCSAR